MTQPEAFGIKQVSQQRNVLFIVIDQLRADCISGALAKHVNLPNLRRFADQSVRFDRHYTVTSPCGPSRASLLTGQYPMNHRSVRNGAPLRHDIPTLPAELRRCGIEPLLYGYTDTSQDPRVHSADDPRLRSYEEAMTGFEEVVEMRMEVCAPWRDHLRDRGYNISGEDIWRPERRPGRPAQLDDPAPYSAEDSDTAYLTDRFLDDIAKRDGPWLAHVNYLRPHPPMVAAPPYNALYDPSDLPMPTRLPDAAAERAVHPYLAVRSKDLSIDQMSNWAAPIMATDDNTQVLRALYLGLATEVDHHVGRILDWLEGSAHRDETLVVITADHGEMLGDRHFWGKTTFYDAAFRVPLLIGVIGGVGGSRVDAPTESVDVAPTILDWLGLQVPNSMDGRSLMPFLSGEPPRDWRDYTYSELDFADPVAPKAWETELGLDIDEANFAILRNERFTLVEFACDLEPVLFDHHGQGEFENVAGRVDYQTDLSCMSRALLRHRMRNADRTLSMTGITADGPKEARRHDI